MSTEAVYVSIQSVWVSTDADFKFTDVGLGYKFIDVSYM